MSTQVQYRRGTQAENDAFTGAIAEITVDTTNWSIRIHDGTTPGGHAVPTLDATQTFTNKTYASPIFTGSVTGNFIPATNNTYTLGNATNSWNSLYVAGNTIYLGSLQLKDIGANTFAIYTADGTTQANVDVGNIDVSSIVSGTSTIGISGTNGNAYVTVAGTSNVVVVSSTGQTTTGFISATGNVTGDNVIGGNLLTGGQVSATGNITGGNLSGASIVGTLTTGSQTNITAVGTLASLAVTANIAGGNLTTAGKVSATGNITTMGKALVGVASTTLTNPVAVFSGAGASYDQVAILNTTGTGSADLAIYGNNGDDTQSWSDIGFTGNTFNDTNYTVTAPGDGYFFVQGNTSFGGNMVLATGANGTTKDIIFATGGFLTGNIKARLYNSTGQFSVVGNVAGGNLTTGGQVSATGNITGGNLSGTSIVGTLTTAAQTNITSVGTLGSLTVTANVAGGNLTTGGQVSATGNITGGNIATSGTISATGVGIFGSGLSVTGNITATGNINYQNVTDLVVGDPLIYIGANNTSNLVDEGVVASYNNGTYYHTGVARNHTDGIWTFFDGVVAEPTTVIDWANATYPTVKMGATQVTTTMSAAGNITGGNILTGGLISATGNITGGNLSGTSIVGTLTTAAQTNITSVGTLGSLTVTANVAGGNITTAGQVSATGNITGGNLSGTSIVGTLTTAAQTNITSVGTLGSLTVTANVAGGNITTAGQVSATGNITGGNLSGTSIVGTLTTAAQTNITSVGTLGSLTVTANVAGGNLTTGGQVSATGNITGGNLSGTSIVGTLTTADQTNITSVGTLGSLTVTANVAGGNLTTGGQVSATGNITGGNLSVGTGTITGGNIVNSNANGIGNIGSASVYYNTVFAKATSAQYADLAEMYAADASYAPGTVLEFGGKHEVTLSTTAASNKIAGVVSTNPAHLMNSVLTSEHSVALALTGRVPTSVVGTVSKGDMMVSGGNGIAIACATPAIGTVIGKALESYDSDKPGVIEVVVGRL